MIDELWEIWFTGYFDGEGSLSVALKLPNNYRPVAGIQTSIADAVLLKDIHSRLGGKYSEHTRNVNTGIGVVSCSEWRVFKGSELINTIIPLFDRHPLKSKKLADYITWRKIVMAIYEGDDIGRRRSEQKNDEIRNLRNFLVESRKASYRQVR